MTEITVRGGFLIDLSYDAEASLTRSIEKSYWYLDEKMT